MRAKMKVLCLSGSRADLGGIEATYHALVKHGVDTTLYRHDVHASCKINEYKIVVLLGDRTEILQFAFDFYRQKMVICHLSGGDITEGSQDDCMRHAITKLSHLHFPTNVHAARVIRQLGEEPWRVHTVGYPGADQLNAADKGVAHALVGAEYYLLVVWHPNTLVPLQEAIDEAAVLRTALNKLYIKKLVLGPNFDTAGYQIANDFEVWAAHTDNRFIGTLPRDMYLTCLKHATALVGNSSSGFYEAPSFGTPVVNIGDRQLGRIVPPNMTQAAVDVDDIIEAINIALLNAELLGRTKDNVYQTGNAADKIAEVIANIKDPQKLLVKKFCHTGHIDP